MAAAAALASALSLVLAAVARLVKGGEDRPPGPGNRKKMTKSQKNHWKRQGGKARKGEKVRLGS